MKKKETIKSDKTQKDVYASIRRSWGSFNPVTRVADDDKKYNRNKSKQQLRKELEDYKCV